MDDEVRNAIQDERIEAIKKSIKVLNDHSGELTDSMAKINVDISEIKIGMASTKTDINWIKKSYFIIYAASVGALITGLINLLIK